MVLSSLLKDMVYSHLLLNKKKNKPSKGEIKEEMKLYHENKLKLKHGENYSNTKNRNKSIEYVKLICKILRNFWIKMRHCSNSKRAE